MVAGTAGASNLGKHVLQLGVTHTNALIRFEDTSDSRGSRIVFQSGYAGSTASTVHMPLY
jgi:hypothetical protein